VSPRELAEGELRILLGELGPDLVTLDVVAERIAATVLDAGPNVAREAAYLALELHRYYTTVEAIFERIARQLDRRLPTGDGWHKALLRQMTMVVDELRPAVIGTEVATELGALLSFRHFLRHAYAVELELSPLEGHRRRVERVHPLLRGELASFKAHLRAMLAWSEG